MTFLKDDYIKWRYTGAIIHLLCTINCPDNHSFKRHRAHIGEKVSCNLAQGPTEDMHLSEVEHDLECKTNQLINKHLL